MGYYKLANNAKTTLSSSLTADATTMTVTSASLFPSPGSDGFLLTIWNKTTYPDPSDDSTMEIVKVTNVNGTTLTITRAQGGTSASAHSSGNTVYLLLTKEHLEQMQTAIDAKLSGGEDVDLGSYKITANEFDIQDATVKITRDGSDNIVFTDAINGSKTMAQLLAGGVVNWGVITGTLSNQSDLQSALDAKQNSLTLGNLTETVSNLLTITGGTGAIIGSGITIEVDDDLSNYDNSTSGFITESDLTSLSLVNISTTGSITGSSFKFQYASVPVSQISAGFSGLTFQDDISGAVTLTSLVAKLDTSDLLEFTTQTISFNDTNTQIWEDGSGNLTFKDAVTGTKTLAQLLAGAGGGSGTVNTIQEGGVQVGGSDIATLNFGTGFDLTESPDTLITVDLDLSEYSGYNNTNWDTAYGWGDHSTEGYLIASDLASLTSEIITSENIEIGSDNAVYFGGKTSDGSWRIRINSGVFVIETRVSGSWVEVVGWNVT